MRRFKMYGVEMLFLGIVFICNMENVVCVCAASLVGKVVSIETKWGYEKVEKQRVSLDVRGIVFAVVLRKSSLPLEEINFGVTVSFVCLVIWRKACVVSIKVAQR